MSRLLIIDDDIASCRTLELHFRSQGHEVRVAHSVDDGLAAARTVVPDLIILDIRMPGRGGLDGLPEFKEMGPDSRVIMITAFHDMDSTIEAMKRGADDYIHKPIDINELDAAVGKALMRVQTKGADISVGREEVAEPGANIMVGHSRAIKEVFKTIGLVAPKPATVLITGESGTGKELVARAVHQAGANPTGPFIAVNCAALVETLLESDLFGHEKGAFTGAVSRQAGKFAMASNGTIFLDEISELSTRVQAKLLRVLQEKEYTPVGGAEVQTTKARVIAATNVDLLERVKEGIFREDLYYRLQVVTIYVPALRERKEDLSDLVPALLTRINRELHHRVTRVTKDVMDAFFAYDWPGNVRELENVLMKAVALCPGEAITPDLMPKAICAEGKVPERDGKSPSQMSLREVEKAHIARVLEAARWHRGRACEILGISRPRLRRLIAQYGLTPPVGIPANDLNAVEQSHEKE
ncbi:MAG: sigma-54-dependent transcriptional regulator [Acidiferrobacterales bacterium]